MANCHMAMYFVTILKAQDESLGKFEKKKRNLKKLKNKNDINLHIELLHELFQSLYIFPQKTKEFLKTASRNLYRFPSPFRSDKSLHRLLSMKLH